MSDSPQFVSIYFTDEGAKYLTDMTKEELIKALEETSAAFKRERELHQLDLELLAPRGCG